MRLFVCKYELSVLTNIIIYDCVQMVAVPKQMCNAVILKDALRLI